MPNLLLENNDYEEQNTNILLKNMIKGIKIYIYRKSKYN